MKCTVEVCGPMPCGQAGLVLQANVTLSSGAEIWSAGGFCRSWGRTVCQTEQGRQAEEVEGFTPVSMCNAHTQSVTVLSFGKD